MTQDFAAKLAAFAESANDIFANIKAVKGGAFSNAVAAGFEARQAIEVIAVISNQSKDNEISQAMCMALLRLITSISTRSALTLSISDALDAGKQADMLFDRRTALVQELKKKG